MLIFLRDFLSKILNQVLSTLPARALIRYLLDVACRSLSLLRHFDYLSVNNHRSGGDDRNSIFGRLFAAVYDPLPAAKGGAHLLRRQDLVLNERKPLRG